jgi:uncharacterized delta-60 repeat protein
VSRLVGIAVVVALLLLGPVRAAQADLVPDPAAKTLSPAVLSPAPYTWAKTYGGGAEEEAWTVQQTSDGGYLVGGYTYSFGAGNTDYWVVRLAADGAVIWQRSYGGAKYDLADLVYQTCDGGYVVTGQSTSFGAGNRDMWLLKLAADGSVQWQKAYGGPGDDEAVGIEQTTDGGYIMAGETNSYGAGDWDVWILKLAADGAVLWQKTYGGTNLETSSADPIQQTADGGYIVTGLTRSFGAGGNDVLVFKLDTQGVVQWQKTYGGPGDDQAHSVRQTNDGGYAVAGFSGSFGAGGLDIWVLKLNAQGTPQWQKTLGTGGTEVAWSVYHTADGGCVVTGSTSSNTAVSTDCWVLKLDATGVLQWQKKFGGSRWDDGESVRPTGDGGYVVAGGTSSFGAGNEDVWVLKLDASGSIPGCSLMVDTQVVPADTHVVGADAYAQTKNSSCSVTTTNATPRVSTGSSRSQCYAGPTPTLTATVTPTDIPRPYRVRLPMVVKASGH